MRALLNCPIDIAQISAIIKLWLRFDRVQSV